jgi:RNA polymerase sigma factor (sigma-70 family)
MRKGLEAWTEADDLMQDAFVKLIHGYPKLDNPQELSRILYGIAKNQITDIGREKQGRRGQIHKAPSVLEGKDNKDPEYFEVEDTVGRVREKTGASEPLKPDEVFERNEKVDLIQRALDALTERDRQIIQLQFLDAPLTPEEIANELGVTVKSLPTTIGRAKKKFKDEYRRLEETT